MCLIRFLYRGNLFALICPIVDFILDAYLRFLVGTLKDFHQLSSVLSDFDHVQDKSLSDSITIGLQLCSDK